MTYDNIKQDVLALGFSEDLEDEGAFLLALNRAQSLLASEFPKRKTLLLARTHKTPERTFVSATGETICLKEGESVAFLYHLSDGEILFSEESLPLESGSGSFVYTARGDGSFSLLGDAEMFAIAIYEKDTPLALCEVALPFVEYDLTKYDNTAKMY